MGDVALHKVTLFWEARLLNYLQAEGLSTLTLKTMMENSVQHWASQGAVGLIPRVDVPTSKALHGGGTRLQSRRVLHFQGWGGKGRRENVENGAVGNAENPVQW